MSFNRHEQIAIYIFRIFVIIVRIVVLRSSAIVDRTSASTQRSKWGTPNRQQCSLPRKEGYRAQYQGSRRGMLTAEGIVQRPVAGSSVASHVEYSAYVHIHTSVHIYTWLKGDKTLSPLAHRKRRVARRESRHLRWNGRVVTVWWLATPGLDTVACCSPPCESTRARHARTHARTRVQHTSARLVSTGTRSRVHVRARVHARTYLVATRERCGHYGHACTHDARSNGREVWAVVQSTSYTYNRERTCNFRIIQERILSISPPSH